jgi:hypothetical protein
MEAKVAGCPPVPRARHLDTPQEDFDLFAERQELGSRSVAWRREVGEGAGLPVRGDVQYRNPGPRTGPIRFPAVTGRMPDNLRRGRW